MARAFDRKLILEDGSEYLGYGFGSHRSTICEIVFETSMAGYQELVSDPSYTDQAVVMTYPLIGTYGIADEDFETRFPTIGGLIVSEYNDHPSNFRCTKTLSEIMEDYNIPGIEVTDTRALARHLRDNGSCRGMFTSVGMPKEEALELIRSTPAPTDAVQRVSCRKPWRSRTANHKFHVVVVDCGLKMSMLRCLNERGCNLTVVPYNATAEQVLALKPDGLFITSGPGNPENVRPVVELIHALRGKMPIFGIDLGNLLIALAYGATTYKMKAGHRGGNHPVRDLATSKIGMASQSHDYAIVEESLAGTGLEVTHRDLIDNTVEGVRCAEDGVFGVQFHPEGAPGPQDFINLFDNFIDLMKEDRHNA